MGLATASDSGRAGGLIYTNMIQSNNTTPQRNGNGIDGDARANSGIGPWAGGPRARELGGGGSWDERGRTAPDGEAGWRRGVAVASSLKEGRERATRGEARRWAAVNCSE